MSRWMIYAIFLIAPWFLHGYTVRLINNSPYDLRAVIRGSDGTYMGELLVRAQKETVWTDTYGQFGLYGGANGKLNQNYRSVTPYTVLWYCMDGSDYAVCDVVATGALVMSQGCIGSRMCKPQKKEKYPYEPQGQYLFQPPNVEEVEPTPPLSQ